MRGPLCGHVSSQPLSAEMPLWFGPRLTGQPSGTAVSGHAINKGAANVRIARPGGCRPPLVYAALWLCGKSTDDRRAVGPEFLALLAVELHLPQDHLVIGAAGVHELLV